MSPEYKLINPKDVKTADYNPRQIAEENFRGLRESVRYFGIIDPLIINTRTDNLIGGHQRLRAALDEGLELVGALYVDLSENDEKLLNVTLNNPNIQGHFTESVADILNKLAAQVGDNILHSMQLSNLNQHIQSIDWETNLNAINNTKDYDDLTATSKITVECPSIIKEEVAAFLKDKLGETTFENIVIR